MTRKSSITAYIKDAEAGTEPEYGSLPGDPNSTQALAEKYEATMVGWKPVTALKVLFCAKILAAILMSVPDADTYHVYALANAEVIRDDLNATPVLSDIAFNWIQYCAPIGVYLFALNNVLRWFEMLNEAIMMFRHYNKLAARWVIYGLTAILAGISVIPFYGMAKSGGLSEFFAIANSVARFCMDHYSWNAIVVQLMDVKCRFQWKDMPMHMIGGLAFVLGALTATYLYPFAEEVSGSALAVFGVAPTCILWGLDSRYSWNKIAKFFYTLITSPRKLCETTGNYEPGIRAGMSIVLAALFLVALAGAFSETMTATNNAAVIGYPPLFLQIVAAVAFTGIYLAAPTGLTESLFQYIQSNRRTPQAVAMREHMETQRSLYFSTKSPFPEEEHTETYTT